MTIAAGENSIISLINPDFTSHGQVLVAWHWAIVFVIFVQIEVIEWLLTKFFATWTLLVASLA